MDAAPLKNLRDVLVMQGSHSVGACEVRHQCMSVLDRRDLGSAGKEP